MTKPNFISLLDIEVRHPDAVPVKHTKFSKFTRLKDSFGREIEPEILAEIEQDGESVFLTEREVELLMSYLDTGKNTHPH